MAAAGISWPQPVERGCGERKRGGVYAEVAMGADGAPIEHFLCDPPILVPADLEIPARGVVLIERGGVTHVVDRIGNKHYPRVTDWVEEARRHGVSRRLPRTLDFSRLTHASQLIMVHDRGWVGNIAEYGTWNCPKNHLDHTPDQHPRMCAGVWWEDADDGIGFGDTREVVIGMPGDWHYETRKRPAGVAPQYKQAFIARFPIGRIVVVRGNDHEAAVAHAQQSQLDVVEVEA